MRIICSHAGKHEVLSYFVFEGEKPKIAGDAGKILSDAVKRKEFDGKDGTALLVRQLGKKILFVGIGKEEEYEDDKLRLAAGKAAAFAYDACAKSMSFAYSKKAGAKAGGAGRYAELVAEGALLATYKFDKYKSQDEEGVKKRLKEIAVDCPGAKQAAEGIAYAQNACEASSLARDIANESGQDAYPQAIAQRAKKMAKDGGLSFRVLDEKQCRKLGMGAYLSVAAGSAQRGAFVVMEYKPAGAKGTVCLVGKGVTFDSGGISLKGGKDMDKMKHDKSGAAAVIGAMKAVAGMKAKVRVIGILPLVENMPSGSATKPGDIVYASNGKSIEVQNTDAEGRMILADALVYAQKYKPDAIITLATLTGAVSVALGSQAAGLLGNRDWLNERVKNSADASHERVWELPLWKEYGEAMKGDFSDLKNISGDGEAGTITAAAFLSNFVGECAWAHIDIAGTAYSYKPKGYFLQTGATGFGVRLLAKMLCAWERAPKNKQ